MTKIPKISESEWEIMKVLWEKSPLTANQIVEILSPIADWKPKTIKTLINRLVNKGVLNFKKSGREYHYFTVLEQSLCIRAASKSFLQRVYGGALCPMLANFLEDHQLSPEEIEELKNLLEKRKEK